MPLRLQRPVSGPLNEKLVEAYAHEATRLRELAASVTTDRLRSRLLKEADNQDRLALGRRGIVQPHPIQPTPVSRAGSSAVELQLGLPKRNGPRPDPSPNLSQHARPALNENLPPETLGCGTLSSVLLAQANGRDVAFVAVASLFLRSGGADRELLNRAWASRCRPRWGAAVKIAPSAADYGVKQFLRPYGLPRALSLDRDILIREGSAKRATQTRAPVFAKECEIRRESQQ
jgi:hypothetical protein